MDVRYGLPKLGVAVDKRARTPIAVAVFICISAFGVLTRSNALATIRAVDALLLFAAGMSVGVALARVIRIRKP
jgi:hypothetical protein